MSDSETMPRADVISKLHEVDPVFREVVGMLFGDAVDPREAYDVAKNAGASGAVGSTPEQRKKERRIAATGIGATSLAGVGGLHAVHMMAAPRIAAARGKEFSEAKKIRNKKVAAGLAAGWAGVHGAELVSDSLAMRANVRAYKANSEVKKALDEGIAQIVTARREGQIDTKTAIDLAVELAESVEKGLGFGVRMANAAKPIMAAKTANAAAAGAKSLKIERRRGVQAALVATGGTAGVGGGVAGFKRGRVRGQQEALAKSEELVDYAFVGEISKTDTDKRLAFGWCSLSEIDGQPVVDLQGDYAPIEEIEKSAYAYVIGSRKGGDMHQRVGDAPLHTSDLVESMIVTPDKLKQMGLSESVAKSVPTGWWVGFKVNDDEQWAKVRSGDRAGFSIHGKGSRVSKMMEA